MPKTIITISRQFGSGGREVGRLVAEKLGMKCYDKEIISKISEKSGFTEQYIQEAGEDVEGGLFTGLGNVGFYEQSNRLAIWNEQCRVIKNLAKEDCVVVGRCADYVLKDEKDVELIKAFIYADMDFRAKRIVELYEESPINPEKRLKEKDKRRSAYYEIYTDQTFGDLLNYDFCLNSSSLTLDRCADIIVDEYKKRSNKVTSNL